MKLADRLFEITTFRPDGMPVNALALVGSDAALLIDSGAASDAAALRAELRALGAWPVRTIINTHHHDDNVGGNHALGPGATVIAHDAVSRRRTTGLALIAPPPSGTDPTITVEREMTVRFAGEELRLVHRPSAHTDGDVTVECVRSGVVAVGDLVFSGGLPSIGVEEGGSLAGSLLALSALAGEYPEGTRFAASHAAVCSTDRVASYARDLLAMGEAVREALAHGSDPGEALRDRLQAARASRGASLAGAEKLIAAVSAELRDALSARPPSVLDRMIPALVEGRGDDAVRLYRTLKAQRPRSYAFDEVDLHRLIDALLVAGRDDDALAIFTLDVEEHPASWSVYDSVGEAFMNRGRAYMAAGKRELAVASYARSLEQGPADPGAKRLLERITSPLQGRPSA